MLSSVPQVSVLMAVYNTPASYLRLAVESILTQTFIDFEFIIIDDGSNSVTRAELHALAVRDPRIILHTLRENVGLTRALNIGLKLTRGTYIARQDADDLSISTRLEISVAFMRENTDIAAVGTCAQLINSAGKSIRVIEPDLRQIYRRNVLVHGAMLFRKQCLEHVGGYNEVMQLSQDYEIYLRMLRKNGMQFSVVPKILYVLRKHDGMLSSRRFFRQLYFSVLAKSLTLPPHPILHRKVNFLILFLFDLIVTHHFLFRPILQRVRGILIKTVV